MSAQHTPALELALSRLPAELQAQAVSLSPSLEDVFISLIADAQLMQGVR
jgi:hypothetical protein